MGVFSSSEEILSLLLSAFSDFFTASDPYVPGFVRSAAHLEICFCNMVLENYEVCIAYDIPTSLDKLLQGFLSPRAQDCGILLSFREDDDESVF